MSRAAPASVPPTVFSSESEVTPPPPPLIPVKFEPSPYKVSAYMFANLTLFVPISVALSELGIIFPVTVVLPATVNAVPFNNCKLSLLHLPVIVCEPALICANSRMPSSVPLLASNILPVIFA